MPRLTDTDGIDAPFESLAHKSPRVVQVTRTALNGQAVTIWVAEADVRATDVVHVKEAK